MNRRSDRYNDSENTENVTVKSRVNKNKSLYDEVNSKIGFEEIPSYETNDEINLASIDMNNLTRSDYQKVKDFKSLMQNENEKEEEKPKEEKKKKNYDINKVLEEAKKNRKADELEEKRSIKDEDYSVLNSLNKKYLHQKGFTEEDNEELKELIDTITSKTMVDDIKDEEEKELLSELLATTIDIKLESELSKTQIQAIADENLSEENSLVDTNSFYSKSLDLSSEDLIDDSEEKKETEDADEPVINVEEDERNVAKIVFVSIMLLIVVLIVTYFILQMLGIKFK